MHRDAEDHVGRNRRFWDADADAYQEVHGADLAARAEAWGAWRRPERELEILGPTRGRDVLELGCGAAQWSTALHAHGARPVGLDVSIGQLRHAQKHAEQHAERHDVPFVLADGESLPFAARSFDVVLSDHGAMSFCDPQRSVPEVARVLRPGGIIAFCVTHPLVYLTYDERRDRQSRKLRMRYDELGCIDFGEGTVDWVIAPGRWVELLTGHGFAIERLVELSPLTDQTTYDEFVPFEWARRWPAELCWRARLS